MLVSRLLLRSYFGIDGLQRVGAAEGLLEGEAFGPFSTPSAVGSAERAGRYRCGDWLRQGTVVKLGASQNGGAQCLTMHLVPSSYEAAESIVRVVGGLKKITRLVPKTPGDGAAGSLNARAPAAKRGRAEASGAPEESQTKILQVESKQQCI